MWEKHTNSNVYVPKVHGQLIWTSVYLSITKRSAITHQHRINHVEAADSITVDMFLIIIVSTVFYVLSRRKIELRDSPRLSLVVSDFVQLDSFSVRKSERRAGFLYKYLYIVFPSHIEVIYQDDILLPVALTGDIGRKSRLPVLHIWRHLDSRSKETPQSVFMLKIKSVLLY